MGDRCREQTLVGADLDEIDPASVVGEHFEFVVPGVRGVQDAQPVPGRLDLVHGPRGAVDQDHVTEHSSEIGLANTRPVAQGWVEGGVVEAAVGGERTVGDHERQFVPPRGQAERVLGIVAHDVQSCEATPDRGGGEVHPVVVVPEQRRPLIQRERIAPRRPGHHRPRIVHGVPAVRAHAAPTHVARAHAVPALAGTGGVRPSLGQDEIGRVSVGACRGPSTVQVHHRRHRQLVSMPHGDRPTAARLDRRSREGAPYVHIGVLTPGSISTVASRWVIS